MNISAIPLFCLLLAPLAYGEDSKPTDEVVVQATRASLVKLGKEVELAQKRFYQRYNQVNTRREYAIKCSEWAPVGTHFTQTRCEPAYQETAEHEESRDFVLSIQNSSMGADPPIRFRAGRIRTRTRLGHHETWAISRTRVDCVAARWSLASTV